MLIIMIISDSEHDQNALRWGRRKTKTARRQTVARCTLIHSLYIYKPAYYSCTRYIFIILHTFTRRILIDTSRRTSNIGN